MRFRLLLSAVILPFILLSIAIQSFPTYANSIPGDCNEDDVLDSADLIAIRDEILANDAIYADECDANEDGVVNSADLACVAHLSNGTNTLCTPPNQASPIGTNLDKVINWSSEYPFVDAFKNSSQWEPRDANWDTVTDPAAQFDLDDDGWIKSMPDCADTQALFCHASTTMLSNYGAHYPAGRYIVENDGSGLLGFSGAGVTVDWANSSAVNGHYELIVTPVNGITLFINWTDPNDYVRNIRVYTPGYDDDNAPEHFFHPDFLASLRDYKVLRFMDWMRTNWVKGAPASLIETADQQVDGKLPRNLSADTVLQWEDRPLPSNARYSTPNGVPAEVMVQLANRLETDAWFNMPHFADDDYVTEFAQLALQQLGAGQKVYVEYSNEIWNSTFDQGIWIEQEGMLMFGVPPTAPANQKLEARLNYYGVRSAEICQLWKQTWGIQAGRVICVTGGQAGNSAAPWLLQQMLDCPLAGGCGGSALDVIAIAPYFGSRIGDARYTSQLENWTVNDLFDQITAGGVLSPSSISELDWAIANMNTYAQEANNRNLPLISYEGGQHLTGISVTVRENVTITNLFTSANLDLQMGDVYDDYFDAWQSAGGQLFNHFMSTSPYSKFGSWGTQQTLNAPIRPKYDAVHDFIENNNCWWIGCMSLPTFNSAEITLSNDPPIIGLQQVPVLLETNGEQINSLALTLRHDSQQMNYISVTSNAPPEFAIDDRYWDDGTTGHLGVTIYEQDAPIAVLQDGVVFTITFGVNSGGTGLWFANVAYGSGIPTYPLSCGDNYGRSIPCTTSGTALTGPPLAVTLSQQTSQSTQFSVWIVLGIALLSGSVLWHKKIMRKT